MDKEERRKFLRFPTALGIEIILKGEIKVTKDTFIKDFSREGMNITIGVSSIKPDKEITLNVRVPGESEVIPIAGSVVWADLKRDDPQLGLKIVNIKSEDKSKILEYVYKQWLKKEKENRKKK